MAGTVPSYISESHVILAVILNPQVLLIDDYGAQFEDYMKDHFAELFGAFGIDDEDVVHVEASSIQLIPQNLLDTLWNDLALKHQLTQKDPVDLLMIKTAPTSSQFSSYYNYGVNNFYDALPTSNVSTLIAPVSAIKYQIDLEYSVDSTIIEADATIPTIDAVCYHYLVDNYSCTPYNQKLVVTSFSYTIKEFVHNTIDDRYEANIYRPADETTEVTVTITPYIEAYSLYDNVVVYIIGDHVMYNDGSGELAYIAIADTTGNPPDPANIGVYWDIVDYDNKQTITERIDGWFGSCNKQCN